MARVFGRACGAGLNAIVGLVSVREYLAVFVLAIAVGAPVVELFDDWDPTIQEGGADTEGNAVVVALCVGMAFATVDLFVRQVLAPLSSSPTPRAETPDPRRVGPQSPLTHVAPHGRAPTPLRV